MRRRPLRTSVPAVALAVLASSALPALAGDGRIEISQTVAEAGGVNGDLVADPPGFPVAITQSGSYVLTSSLSVSDPDTHGITVDAADVHIDFNGFGIEGPGVGGSGDGVRRADVGLANRAVIRNGYVRRVGRHGIQMDSARVVDMSLFANGGNGIEIFGGEIIGCEILLNAANGIRKLSVDRLHIERTGIGIHFSGESFAESFPTGGLSFGPGVRCDDDARCNRPGLRVYYLSNPPFVAGDAATTACDDGFHMASRAELTNPSSLYYDVNRGLTSDDSGIGPTNVLGWIRTGVDADTTNSAGGANCDAWTSGSNAHWGSAMAFDPAATLAAERSHPWKVSTLACDFAAPVWCVQN